VTQKTAGDYLKSLVKNTFAGRLTASNLQCQCRLGPDKTPFFHKIHGVVKTDDNRFRVIRHRFGPVRTDEEDPADPWLCADAWAYIQTKGKFPDKIIVYRPWFNTISEITADKQPCNPGSRKWNFLSERL